MRRFVLVLFAVSMVAILVVGYWGFSIAYGKHLQALHQQYESTGETYKFNLRFVDKLPPDVWMAFPIGWSPYRIVEATYQQMNKARRQYNEATSHWFVPARSLRGLPAKL